MNVAGSATGVKQKFTIHTGSMGPAGTPKGVKNGKGGSRVQHVKVVQFKFENFTQNFLRWDPRHFCV